MSYLARRRRSSMVVALVVVAALAGCGSSDAMEPVRDPVATRTEAGTSQLLAPAEFAATISDTGVVVVNVHVPYDGHIDGTDAFVPFDEIASWPDLPDDRTTPIAVYCRSGNMSATATESLVALGYTNVVDLADGMNAWVSDGQQLERF